MTRYAAFCSVCEMNLTTKQRYLLSAEASVDPRTIKNAYAGKPTKDIVRERITEAAKKLNLPKPPKPIAKEIA